jgi:hypothetical protein
MIGKKKKTEKHIHSKKLTKATITFHNGICLLCLILTAIVYLPNLIADL